MPASEAQLRGDFSDLLRLPEPGAVPDLRSADGASRPGESEPVHPRSVPEQHHPGEPDREPALQPVPADGAAAESEPVENGATPTNNYYRGGEPDKPVSSLYAGRIDYNLSATDRFFFRGLRQHVPRAGERLDLRGAGVRRAALDRSVALQLGGDRQLDATSRGKTVIDTPGREQPLLPGRPAAAAARVQADRHGHARVPRRVLRGAERLHAARGARIGGYQGISQGAVSRRHARRTCRARST